MERALAGRKVLVTRALEDSRRWAKRLAAHGADPVIMPCVRTEAMDDEATRERLVDACQGADWLVFTSARGVEAVERMGVRPTARVAAVGKATGAAAATAFACTPFVGRGGTSRALGEELVAFWGATATARRVVVVGAEGGRDDAERALARGGARVTRVDVYRTVPAAPATPRRDLEQEGIADVLLASPSAVAGFTNQARFGSSTRIFTIGPTTSAAATAAGLVVAGESATPDLEGLMEAML